MLVLHREGSSRLRHADLTFKARIKGCEALVLLDERLGGRELFLRVLPHLPALKRDRGRVRSERGGLSVRASVRACVRVCVLCGGHTHLLVGSVDESLKLWHEELGVGAKGVLEALS